MIGLTARRAAARVAAVTGAGLWLAGLFAFPLLESTEGRYASIAAGMARGDGLMEPRFNGLLHLDKPPLTYWLGALALRLHAGSAGAARVPALLAWLGTAVLVLRLARACGVDAVRARWAGVFAALAPLAVVQARMLSCDVFLWPAVVGVYAVLVGPPRPVARRAAVAGLCLGWGMLAKGHIVLFWTVLPVVVDAALGRTRERMRVLFHPLALGGLVLVGLPWFLVEAARRPGLVDFWLGRETAGRFLSSVHGRTGPWWYFLPLVPLAVLPWLPEVVRGTRRAVRVLVTRRLPASGGAPEPPALDASSARLLLTWIVVPLVLLSISESKRFNYVLPLVAPLCVLAAASLPARVGERVWWRAGIWATVCTLVPFVLGAAPAFVPPTQRLVTAAARHGGPLAAYRTLPSSLPFYAGTAVPTVGVGWGSPLDTRADLERWAPASAEALLPALDAGGQVLARCGAQAELEALLQRKLAVRATAGRLCLLSAAQRAVPDP